MFRFKEKQFGVTEVKRKTVPEPRMYSSIRDESKC